MTILNSMWLVVKMLVCIWLIVLLLSLILDNLIREIQNIMFEKAKRDAIKSIATASTKERQQFLDFIDIVANSQNKVPKSKSKEKE